ncbi:hypothetical protein T484DRAFT_3649390, partial [Baffinella frigidus]
MRVLITLLSAALLLTSHAVAAAFPWTTAQQNDQFLALVGAKPPVGINIFSHYDAVSGKVPDARGNGYDVTATKTITVDVTIANRIYPPTNVVVFTTENTRWLYGIFSLTDQSYGNGEYTVRASTRYNSAYEFPPWRIFRYFNSASDGGNWEANQYWLGLYQNSASLDGNYKGDWLTIKHPAPFVLKSFQFKNAGRETETMNMPGKFKIYGRNDGGAWSAPLYTQSADPSTFTADAIYYTTTTLSYSEYGVVVGHLRSDNQQWATRLSFHAFKMWGHPTPTVATTTTVATQLSIETEHFISEELQFPLVGATIVFDEPTSTGCTMRTSNTPYANGDSTLTWSSAYGSYPSSDIFNPVSTSIGGHWDLGYTNGVASTSNQLVDGYTGDWFVFNGPACFSMTSVQFIPRVGNPGRVPGLFVIYARNLDTDSWTPVHTQSTKAAG